MGRCTGSQGVGTKSSWSLVPSRGLENPAVTAQERHTTTVRASHVKPRSRNTDGINGAEPGRVRRYVSLRSPSMRCSQPPRSARSAGRGGGESLHPCALNQKPRDHPQFPKFCDERKSAHNTHVTWQEERRKADERISKTVDDQQYA